MILMFICLLYINQCIKPINSYISIKTQALQYCKIETIINLPIHSIFRKTKKEILFIPSVYNLNPCFHDHYHDNHFLSLLVDKYYDIHIVQVNDYSYYHIHKAIEECFEYFPNICSIITSELSCCHLLHSFINLKYKIPSCIFIDPIPLSIFNNIDLNQKKKCLLPYIESYESTHQYSKYIPSTLSNIQLQLKYKQFQQINKFDVIYSQYYSYNTSIINETIIEDINDNIFNEMLLYPTYYTNPIKKRKRGINRMIKKNEDKYLEIEHILSFPYLSNDKIVQLQEYGKQLLFLSTFTPQIHLNAINEDEVLDYMSNLFDIIGYESTNELSLALNAHYAISANIDNEESNYMLKYEEEEENMWSLNDEHIHKNLANFIHDYLCLLDMS